MKITAKALAYFIFLPMLIASFQVSFLGHTFKVVPQNGSYMYVAPGPDTLTRNELARSEAYLAHDQGAGRYFDDLAVGDTVIAGETYTVSRVDYYRISGEYFINKATAAVYDVAGLWSIYYLYPGKLVLQTCTGDGRMFVVGEMQ